MRILLAASFFALPAVAAERSPQEIEQLARKLLAQAYNRPDVRSFCGSNPDSVYAVEMGSNGEVVAITVRCRAYHDWLVTVAHEKDE